VSLVVDGRSLRVTSLDRVLFADGFTKGALLDYYARVAGVMVPHIRGRPMTLARFPSGVEAGGFYQTSCPHPPEWMATLPAGRRDYCLIDDAAGLLWAANLASIEFHPLLSVAPDIDTPTMVLFDLDPGAGAGLGECCEVALLLQELLDGLGLSAWAKTSGGLGLHVCVPVNGSCSYAKTKTFARSVAALLADRHPALVVDRQDKRRRAGRVLVDWSQNDRNKSTTAVYSVKAGSWPSVSTPLTWDEVAAGVADEPRFRPEEVLDRVAAHGDLFAPVLTVSQSIGRIGFRG
jgi:bifunctional non-homologous end joining protein LigD